MDYKIFDTLLEPVFVINADKKIIYCNDPVAVICDMSVRKITRGQIFDQLLKFSEPLIFLTDITKITDPTPYQEIGFTSESGKNGKVQLTCQPLTDSTWIIYFRDVTLEETLQKKYRAELEQVQHYSKNLEKMVDERTFEIKKLNEKMSALLDSLGQGFFIFNSEGICLDIYSKACEVTIETIPAKQKIWDVLKLEQKQLTGFKNWMKTIFAEMLPFEDLSALGPATFPHSLGKHIQLEYYPLKSNEGQMDGVVVVSTDITSLIEAKKEAEIERAHAKMIVNLMQNKRQVNSFLRESEELLTELKFELQKDEKLDQANTFRLLHTLKGGSASFSIKAMADVCHAAEGALANFKWDGITKQGVEKLSILSSQIDLQFKKFLFDNRAIIGSKEKQSERWIEAPVSKLVFFKSKLPAALSQEFLESFVFDSIGEYFKHSNSVIQSVAEQEGKQIAPLKMINSELPILPEAYENIFSTFIHAFRNAADHGIEAPEVRQENGKNEIGNIEIKFLKFKNRMLIQITDDGGGISADKIREKLEKNGIKTQHESNKQIIQHIFDSQFSTKDQVTETSGRGVGMDAIQFAAKNLGGKAWVKSNLGKGTTLYVCVPYITEIKNLTFKKVA